MRVELFYGTFLYKRLVFVVALALIISILNPMLTKMQGQFLSVLEVVVLSWCVIIGSLLQISLKNVCLKKLFWGSVIIEVLCVTDIILYYFNIISVEIFLYSIVFLEALIVCVNGALGIRTRVFISKLFSNKFKDFEFSCIFVSNTTLLIGGITIFFILMFVELKTGLLIASLSYVFMIWVEFYQIKDIIKMEKEYDRLSEN